jgi:hypothetical protein
MLVWLGNLVVSKPIRSMELFAVIDRLLVSNPVVNAVV